MTERIRGTKMTTHAKHMGHGKESAMNDDFDASEVLDTLRITKVERRTSAGGAWVSGTIADHRFDALVFPEHAEVPEYELGDSRISKLWIQRISDRLTVVNFDR